MQDAALSVTFASASAIGDRSANEDSLGERIGACGSCYVVSDGAGGHVGGGIASRLVVDAMLQEVAQRSHFSADVLEHGFVRAAASIAERKRHDASLGSMSATVVALLIDPTGRRAVFGHLGDSRILRFRRGALASVTRDHSVVQRLVDAGYVSADRAAAHPGRNLLYGAVGAEGDATPAIEREPIALRDGDAFLLCTDGFWGRIENDRIEQSLRVAVDVSEWIDDMRRTVANDVPAGADNYTAMGVWIGSPADVTVSRAARQGDLPSKR
jgi:serine/threonine protein phosphatase PrpC